MKDIYQMEELKKVEEKAINKKQKLKLLLLNERKLT